MQIKRWNDYAVLWEGGCDNIRDELEAAIAAKTDLSRAFLSGADLSEADLSGAFLSGADLSDADLSRADLSGVKTPPMKSYDFWAELLLRAASDDLHRRMVAGLVLAALPRAYPGGRGAGDGLAGVGG